MVRAARGYAPSLLITWHSRPLFRPRDGIRMALHDPFTAQPGLFQHTFFHLTIRSSRPYLFDKLTNATVNWLNFRIENLRQRAVKLPGVA